VATRKKLPAPEIRGLPREVVKALEEWKELALARERIGRAAYDHQDSQTQDVMDRIRDRLVTGASGLVAIGGHRVKVDLQYIEANAMYVSTEIMKDLALMDVKVANYKFPPVFCAECGAEIKKLPTRKRKKVKS
jgi:hypothetical protein